MTEERFISVIGKLFEDTSDSDKRVSDASCFDKILMVCDHIK